MSSSAHSSQASSLPVTAHLPGAVTWWRRAMGWTQAELAARAGLSASEVKWLERGRKNGPRTDTLERVCVAMGISLVELVLRADQQSRLLMSSRGV